MFSSARQPAPSHFHPLTTKTHVLVLLPSRLNHKAPQFFFSSSFVPSRNALKPSLLCHKLDPLKLIMVGVRDFFLMTSTYLTVFFSFQNHKKTCSFPWCSEFLFILLRRGLRQPNPTWRRLRPVVAGALWFLWDSARQLRFRERQPVVITRDLLAAVTTRWQPVWHCEKGGWKRGACGWAWLSGCGVSGGEPCETCVCWILYFKGRIKENVISLEI